MRKAGNVFLLSQELGATTSVVEACNAVVKLTEEDNEPLPVGNCLLAAQVGFIRFSSEGRLLFIHHLHA